MLQNFLLPFLSGLLGTGITIFLAKEFFSHAIEHAFKRALLEREIVAKSDLEFRKQQLAEFYGPIYAYMKLAERLYALWMEGALQDINSEIITLFRQQNEEIMRLLASKMHLVDDPTVPPSFTRFATAVTLWNLYTARPDQPWFPDHIAKLDEAQWPAEFQEYIYHKTEDLKALVSKLHEEHGLLGAAQRTARMGRD